MSTKTMSGPKQIADPVERARALRAARQSRPAPDGSTPLKVGSKSPIAAAGARAGIPGSAGGPMRPGASGSRPGTAGPVDRTLGARGTKRRDHLAPKASGIDKRLAEFQVATRTICRKRPNGPPSEGDGASPLPGGAGEGGDEGGDHVDAGAVARPQGAGKAANGAGAAGAAAGGDVDSGDEDQGSAKGDPDAHLSAMVRGEDENWFEVIQRKEEAERQKVEDEERARKLAEEKRERDARDEEIRRRRKEEDDVRKRELQEKRERRQAERREQSDQKLEDRARQLELERQQILQQAGIGASLETSASKVAQERSARKARIAELVSKVRGASLSDNAPEADSPHDDHHDDHPEEDHHEEDHHDEDDHDGEHEDGADAFDAQ